MRRASTRRSHLRRTSERTATATTADHAAGGGNTQQAGREPCGSVPQGEGEGRAHRTLAVPVAMDDCIEWDGARTPKGYGTVGGGSNKQYIHRLTWAEANGPIPPGLEIRHSCDNPPCYNIEHLLLGTSADNHADMVARGRGHGRRSDMTHCIHGHEFTEENTYLWRGQKQCRACHARRARERRARTTTGKPENGESL